MSCWQSLDVREIGPDFEKQHPEECLRRDTGSPAIRVVEHGGGFFDEVERDPFVDQRQWMVLRNHLGEEFTIEEVRLAGSFAEHLAITPVNTRFLVRHG